MMFFKTIGIARLIIFPAIIFFDFSLRYFVILKKKCNFARRLYPRLTGWRALI